MESKKELIKNFEPLNRREILSLQPGRWDDYDLLDVVQHFEEQNEDERAVAVVELILRSPGHSELVDYAELYLDLVHYYQFEGDAPAALYWSHTMIAYGEQHEAGENRANHHRTLAEVYLESGDLNTALKLYTRRLRIDPGDIWTYNSLGMALPDVGLDGLAVEALGRGLSLVDPDDPERLREQLEDLRREAEETADNHALGEVDARVLAEFRAALDLPVEGETGADQMEPYLPPILNLLEAGPQVDPALHAEILAQGKVLAPELIRLAFDPSLPDEGVRAQAVSLLRELHRTGMAGLEGLSSWLERAEGDWRAELLASDIGKIGGYTTPELEAFAADSEVPEDFRLGAVHALVERAQRLPAQREQVVSFFRTLLTRPQAYEAAEETFIGFLISAIFDLGARELLPEIRKAYDEDRVDPTIIALADVLEGWGIPAPPEPPRREDGLYLLLQCTSCGRARWHFVQVVLADTGTLDKQEQGQQVRYDPFIMDHEIICPKCGARDQYELTPQASMMLVGPQDPETFVEILAGKQPSRPLKANPRVYFFESAVLGQPMHPFEGLKEYERLIAARPGDARLHLGLANLLRVLFRYERSLEEYRFASELDPNDPEIAIARAMAEHDFGDREDARRMYEKVLALEMKDIRSLLRPAGDLELSAVAAQGLNALNRGQPSGWEPAVYNEAGERLPLARPFPSPKKGSPVEKKGKRRRKK